MYDNDVINRIKENIDIVDVIREFVPSLKSAGRDFKGLSPFTNEKTPSFTVSREKQFFKDFSSGKGGDVFTFIREYHNMTFNEAVEFLANRVGIELKKTKVVKTNLDKIDNLRKALNIAADFFHKNLLNNEGIAFHYLIERGINTQSINDFQIGYASNSWDELHKYLKKYELEDSILVEAGLLKNANNKLYDAYRHRIIFPIRDDLGRVVGLGGRIIEKDEKSAKYINSPQNLIYDKSKILYGLFESKREINNLDAAILVEGYLDVISLHQAGIKNVIASSGTALSEQQIKLISRHTKNLFIIFDSDKAGVSAANRVMNIALENNVNVKLVQLPDGEDPDSIVHNYGKNTFNQYLNKSIDFVEYRIKTNKDSDSPSSQADLLRGLINSIKLIPDRLRHDFYIKRIADILNLSELQITNVYLEKKNLELQDRKRDRFKDEKISELKSVEKDESSSTYEDFKERISDLLNAEILILQYLLEHFDIFYELTEEFDIGEETFISDKAKQIYSVFLEADASSKDIFDFLFEEDELDLILKDIITGLPFYKDELNTKLAESRQIDIILPKETIIQSLISLKMFKIDSLMGDIFNEETEEFDDDVLIKQQNLKNEILELEVKRNELLSA